MFYFPSTQGIQSPRKLRLTRLCQVAEDCLQKWESVSELQWHWMPPNILALLGHALATYLLVCVLGIHFLFHSLEELHQSCWTTSHTPWYVPVWKLSLQPCISSMYSWIQNKVSFTVHTAWSWLNSPTKDSCLLFLFIDQCIIPWLFFLKCTYIIFNMCMEATKKHGLSSEAAISQNDKNLC